MTGATCVVLCAAWAASCATSRSESEPVAQTVVPGTPPPELAAPPPPPPPAARPLVLSVVIDQLGSETLERLAPLLDAKGFYARVREQGRVYSKVVYPYAATLTAPGHAAIYSGAVPAQSCITANTRLDPATGKKIAFVDDGAKSGPVIDAKELWASPALLKADTVADALKAATQGKGIVVSVSMKDRSSIFPAGKRHDVVALWFETSISKFTTSEWYGAAPDWLAWWNAGHPVDLALVWKVEDDARKAQLKAVQQSEDEVASEGAPFGWTSAFPHKLADVRDPKDATLDLKAKVSAWLLLPESTDALLDLALAASEKEHLCEDDVPDLLAVSISGTDLVGHNFGPSSWEYAEALTSADRKLASLVEKLEQRCQVSVLLTSDHGAARIPEQSGSERIPADFAAQLEAKLAKALKPRQRKLKKWIAGFEAPYVYLSKEALEHPDADAVRAQVAQLAAGFPGVREGIDTHDLDALSARGDALGAQLLMSICPGVSGDVFIVTKPGAVPDFNGNGKGTSHGSPYAYDTEVPVLVLGPGIAPAQHPEALDQRRVASTLSALLHVPAPQASAPAPLPGIN